MSVTYTNNEFFNCLEDIDGCVIQCLVPPNEEQERALKKTFELAKPGSNIVLISQMPVSIDWAILLEQIGLLIKDQIIVASCDSVYTLVWGIKPYEESYANNAIVHKVAGINIDVLRVGTETVGWNGLGKTGKTWTEKTCGFRNEQEARPVVGRFPGNLIFTKDRIKALVDSEQLPEKTQKFYMILSDSSLKEIYSYCLDLIAPPTSGLMLGLFVKNNIFETICQEKNHKSMTLESFYDT